MTLLKSSDYNSREINVALLSLEADIKNKITNFDTSVIDKQLVEINSRIDKINAGSNNTSAEINDIRYEIEDINSKLNGNSAKIENIEQKLTDIFSAENKVTDFNTTTNSGIYYWATDAANKPDANYGVLLVNKYDSGSTNIWINQIAYGTNNKIYFRQNINSGNWTEWKAVAFDGEITANKVANALIVNGKTYNGSEAVDAGVQKIENGGTGATTAKEAEYNIVVPTQNDTIDAEAITDESRWTGTYLNPSKTTGRLYTKKFSVVWNYIKDKISSVLGLTKDSYGGKAATAGTADKVANALTVNGKTYDGSSAVNAGVQTVANGGTGVTTQEDINKAFINDLYVGNDDVTDGTEFVSSYASENGFADSSALNKPYKRQFIKVWNYIKGKISSVLGLTKDNYGGNSATATTAASAKNMYSQTLDLSALDKTKFYPVFCISSQDFTEFAVFSNGGKSSAEYNQNRIHFDISTLGWADEPFTLNIREYACFDNKEITIGCIGRGLQDGGWAIWLRGGLTYHCFARNCSLSLKTSDYTFGGEKYTVGTNYYGGTNSNVKIVFTPQSTITNGAYSTRPITAPVIKATTNFIGNLTGNVTGKSAKSSFLNEYVGAGGTRLTSGNIVPKDASEYGGMRKDVVTSSMTDSGRPNLDGHLLTMFWDNNGRYDSQLFVSNSGDHPGVKVRYKTSGTDYGDWIDIITSNNIGSQTVANATNARTAADAGYLCKLYQLAYAIQTYNVILLGKIPDPASTEAPATPSVSWDIDVDFYFIRPQGHKAAWCNVKAGYGYSNAWRKYGLIETFGVDSNSNYTNPFYLVTVKYNNEYYIGVRHLVDIDGKYSARVNNVNTNGNGNPSTADSSSLVNMLKVIPYQKTTDGTVLNNEIKTSIADFPNTYAPAVERNGDLILKSGYARIGNSGVAGSKLTIHGATVNSNSYTDTNPKLEFKNNDGSQNISLTFTDFDAVQAPASLTLNGNQGNEYFIAPNIKATTKFTGNLTGNVTGNVSGSSGSANKLTTARTAYVDLGTASTTRTIDWSGDTTIPVNGTLGVANGGTGATTAEGAANSLIASLSASDKVPVDSDYFISQVVNGGPFVPGYERRPISKLWEYIKGKILQEGEDLGYNHIVYDDASLLEWANCTDGSMKKVLVKSGTYNMTKGVDFSKAGTGYVFAENGAVINSKVPIAFSAPSGKTAVHNLSVICGPSSDNSCAFSAGDVLNLILYDCDASYSNGTVTVNRNLFSKCTCYNCHYNFTYSSSNSSMSIKVFYQCYCYNCICKQTIAANSSSGVSFNDTSYFYKECVCISCDAELSISRNIKAATPSFSCYYNCWDRCVGCLSKINVNSNALTVYSTLYGFLRCQHMSSCKETHTVGYTNIKGIVQCIYISATSAVSGESNTSVGSSCDI